jgi:hypothetical protein
MPVRDLRSNTIYWGTDQAERLALGTADTQIQLASDYQPFAQIVTAASASTTPDAFIYRMNSGSAQALTIAPSGYYQAGAVITVVQEGAGAVTITAGAGVTVNTALAGLVTQGQWNVAQLIYTSANNLVAIGGLGA